MKKKSVKKEKVTIEHIAELVSANSVHIDKLTSAVEQNSSDIKNLYAKLDESIDELADATKKGFEDMEKVFEQKLEGEIGTVNFELQKINNRLELIEGVRYNTYETRIENLEDAVRTVKTKLKIK
jgi:exonuclease VII large subunit